MLIGNKANFIAIYCPCPPWYLYIKFLKVKRSYSIIRYCQSILVNAQKFDNLKKGCHVSLKYEFILV